MQADESETAQRERARQAWELIVNEPPDPPVLAALRKVLRVKRFDLPELAARLPGRVRRGARVDLEPLAAALREAGLRCELRERAD